jgi:hypothetical protein
MANPIGARQHAIFKAISTAPSFNKTPVGASTPPLPYPTLQDLSNSVGVVPNVRFNGKPAYVLDQSTQPSGKGDGPGIAKGVKSGTVTGQVKPIKGATTVRAGKKHVVRHGDPCTMNGGNNPGIYCTTQMPSAVAPKVPARTPPKIAPQTEAEHSFLNHASDSARSLAKKYQERVSKPLHDFAVQAMDKGGTIAAAGGTAALVGGGMAATGIGAAPGAVLAAGGGAVATVGGGVATVGAITETVATGADAVATFMVSGKTPDVIGIATAYAERVVVNKIEKVVGLIPGGKGKLRQLEHDAGESIKKARRGKPGGGDKKPGPAGDGTKVVGQGKGGGRCKLRKYREGCPSGTPHHVVPDHCFKQPGKNGKYYPGAIEHADGLSICVDGRSKSEATKKGEFVSRGKLSAKEHFDSLAQHGRIHVLMDAAELALGEVGNPKYTATLGQLEEKGAASVAAVTGCDRADLEQQLRTYHQSKGLGTDMRLRADPFGRAKALDPKAMGTSMRSGPRSRD